MLTIYCFSLPDIRCANCVRPIENTLRDCTHVDIENFAVDLVEKKLTVTVDDDRDPVLIRNLLRTELEDVGINCIDIDLPPEPRSLKTILRSHWFLGLLGTTSGVALMVLSMAATLPLVAMIALAASSIALTLFLGAEAYRQALKKLIKTRTLTMDTLFAVSTLTVLVVSLAAFFFPWLPMMFEAGLLIFGFRHVGLAIEESIKQTMALGAKFTDRTPKHVRVVDRDSYQDKDVLSLELGELILIEPGEVIPVDGLCEQASFIFDTIVTGAIVPRLYRHGDPLLAGMRLPEGEPALQVRVTASAKESHLAKLDKHIMLANLEKAPLETTTNKILQFFIPTVILFAILSAVIISHFFPIAVAIQCAVSVLVSACPCTLGFITPLAVKIGMKKAGDNGVIFTSAKRLQEAEQIDRVVFDLNGTLTTGVLKVGNHGVFENAGMSGRDLLTYLATLEQGSSHLVAKAICEYTQTMNIPLDPQLRLSERDGSNHSGVSAKINDELYTLGNRTMMESIGIEALAIPALPEHLNPADSVIYLARAQQVIGYIIISDPLRANARLTVDALRQLGKDVYICTGADEVTAHNYARMLGIPAANVAAACAGSAETAEHNKKAYINRLKEDGHRVAMIGDAANDTLAMAASDFSIAIKSQGADPMTQQQAGAVTQSDSLLAVVSAFAVAQQTVNNIRQNLLMSLGYNSAAMLTTSGLLLTIGITLNPSVGAALMIFQSSLILLNAFRFKQQGLPHAHLQTENSLPPNNSYNLMQASLPTPRFGIQVELTTDRDSDYSSLFTQDSGPADPHLLSTCITSSNTLMV